jgi:predicted PhzF superfamily epimerase YddE/YHI9
VATLHVLRVFCAADGSGGNRLGVFLDGAEVAEADRQAVAAELGYSETAFVEDRERGEIRIFTPEVELALAGHPMVGTAWLLAHEGTPVQRLRPPAGEVGVTYEGELTRVAAPAKWGQEFEFVQLRSPEEVEALNRAPEGMGWVGMWSWIDEAAGLIRERVFVPEAGIPEDEATGLAAMHLVDRLARRIEIHQGKGSVIYARKLEDGRAEIGGRVVLESAGQWSRGERRPYGSAPLAQNAPSGTRTRTSDLKDRNSDQLS